MLSLDGCGGDLAVVILHRKPNLDGEWGSARNPSVKRVHNS